MSRRKTTEKLTRAKIAKIREKANRNILKIVSKLKLRLCDKGTHLQGCCPIPHTSASLTPNDNPTAFSWKFDAGIWSCFSNHCEQIYGADIFGLVRALKDLGFYESVNYVCKLLDLDIESAPEMTTQEMAQLKQYIYKNTQIHQHKRIEEDLMKHLQAHPYLIEQRGFKLETIQEFKCGYWSRKNTMGDNRILIPIYDHQDDFLIGFTGRSLSRPPKWLHCINYASEWSKDTENLHTGSILFNMHRAKNHMGKPATIIVVEGPLDVMRLHEAGIKNAVAILGSKFTQQKRQILRELGVRRLIFALDNDDSGYKALQAAIKTCERYFDISEIVLPQDKDPGDLPIQRLQKLFTVKS